MINGRGWNQRTQTTIQRVFKTTIHTEIPDLVALQENHAKTHQNKNIIIDEASGNQRYESTDLG